MILFLSLLKSFILAHGLTIMKDTIVQTCETGGNELQLHYDCSSLGMLPSLKIFYETPERGPGGT